MSTWWVEHSRSLHKQGIPNFRSTKARSEHLDERILMFSRVIIWVLFLQPNHTMYISDSAFLPTQSPLLGYLDFPSLFFSVQKRHLFCPSSLFWPAWPLVTVSPSSWQSITVSPTIQNFTNILPSRTFHRWLPHSTSDSELFSASLWYLCLICTTHILTSGTSQHQRFFSCSVSPVKQQCEQQSML